jgi:hypothetical protein
MLLSSEKEWIIGTQKNLNELSVVIHAYNPSTWGAEAGGLRVWSQSGLHSEILAQKKKKKSETQKHFAK